MRPYKAVNSLYKIMPYNPVTLCRDLRTVLPLVISLKLTINRNPEVKVLSFCFGFSAINYNPEVKVLSFRFEFNAICHSPGVKGLLFALSLVPTCANDKTHTREKFLVIVNISFPVGYHISGSGIWLA